MEYEVSEKLSDILPPSDGWGAMIIPIELKPFPPGSIEAFMRALPASAQVEFTISGFYDDVGAGEPPADRN